MGDIVNLRIVRKRKTRKHDDDKADQQRVLHGLSKGEKSLARARDEKSRRDLDQHRIKPGDMK